LRITDTGQGIDTKVQPLIFDPFYSTKSAGHGLGLSAVLGIVSSHEAAIKVESALGEGTTVTLLFPAGASLAASGAVQTSDAPPRGEGRVLVVDDEAAVRKMAALVLREAGYEVLEACDGEEALALVKTSGGSLHAVLLDVTMPKRDGCSTLAELRKTHPTLPVLLSSGKLRVLTESQEQDPFLRLLHKPYLAEALVAAVADAIGCSMVPDEHSQGTPVP
jgi:CheY-like chemotaxis protein